MSLVTLLAAATAWGVGVPALAGTVVVGYVPPGVDFGADDGGGGGEMEPGEVRAQGVVVDNLEPGARALGTRDRCPSEGCRYELIVVDPAALREGAGGGSPTVGCDALEYAVIDPEPDETPLGSGARVYTGHGSLPAQTADTPAPATPRVLTSGVGLLCFATPAGDQGLRNNAGDGALAATQPQPVVIFHDADVTSGD